MKTLPVMDLSDGRGKRHQGASRTAGAISPVYHVASNSAPTYMVQGTGDVYLPSTQLLKTKYDELTVRNGGKPSFPLHFDIIEGMTHMSRPDAFYAAMRTNAVSLFRNAGILEKNAEARP